MQLRSVDLPAPLGPMRPTISPASTASETSLSARRPEKDSDRRSTSSSATRHPPPRAGGEIAEADQPARQELHAEDECRAVDNHLRILELAENLGRERQIGAAEQRA